MTELLQILNIIQQSTAFKIAQMAGVALVALSWIGVVIFVSKDSERRYKNERLRVFATILAIALYIPGLIIYLVIRPAKTLHEELSTKLLEDAVHDAGQCTVCKTSNSDKHRFCTRCGQALLKACPECGEGVRHHWAHCPHCQSRLAPVVE